MISWNNSPDEKTEGRVRDMYLDTTNFDLYQLSKNGWDLLGNIAGEDGEDGITPVVEINDKGN